VRDFGQVEKALKAGGQLNKWLDRVWPTVAADELVRSLLTQRALLEEAAAGILNEDEQRLLLRKRAGFAWSDGDVPLVDEARTLLAEAPRVYGHAIVDEAQDLTPMQLRAVGRRTALGSLTILGDIAQATGPVAYLSWSELLPYLPQGDDAAVVELRHAYRVPREIMELALPLLELIAPDVEPPLAFREGAAPPRLVQVEAEALLPAALQEATDLAGDGGLVAVIGPEGLVPELDAEGITVLGARRSKGLEFDHVVVVEPAAIADEEHGLRGLYVALTRPTRTLVVVHARPLPVELAV
jgi:DNA helicase IV